MAEQAIGVFGGTFDPIHVGHLAAAEDAATALELGTVLFVPNRLPPHKLGQAVTRVEDRVAMVRLAVADNELFALSTVEVDREGPSYTLDTMRVLQGKLGDRTRLVFLTGCDSMHGLHTWHEPAALLEEFEVAVLERPTGQPVDWEAAERYFPHIREQVKIVRIPLLEISSQDLRARVSQGRPIRYYVLPAVERYIREHRLYRVER